MTVIGGGGVGGQAKEANDQCHVAGQEISTSEQIEKVHREG